MQIKNRFLELLLLCLTFSFFLVSCSCPMNCNKMNNNTAQTTERTDYSKANHWLSLPSTNKHKVDVFYLYPSVFHKLDDNEPNVCDIDNSTMLAGSKKAFAKQATAFETFSDIYAPYYRQADLKSTLALPVEEQEKVIGGKPKSDIIAAFDYYIKHYNNGRPFILAAHSQGSDLMMYILAEYMKEHPEAYKNMVAAYVIGYSVTQDYLDKNPHLKFAEGPDDTGVIISYNTEAPQVEGTNPVLLPGAISINPISWTRDETPATAKDSLGSLMENEDGTLSKVEHYADAIVDKERGVVVCSSVDVEKLSPGGEVFSKGVYHKYDYPFYYFNIRENAKNRAEKFIGE